jgi:putative membrane protein insertion efficiency factor
VADQDPRLGRSGEIVGRATGALSRALMAPIVAYRRWISPALPDRCRFYPSCSEYALTALATHGPVRGLWLTVRRLLRCHPFHPGGIDHVPPPRNPASRTPATTRLEQ